MAQVPGECVARPPSLSKLLSSQKNMSYFLHHSSSVPLIIPNMNQIWNFKIFVHFFKVKFLGPKHEKSIFLEERKNLLSSEIFEHYSWKGWIGTEDEVCFAAWHGYLLASGDCECRLFFVPESILTGIIFSSLSANPIHWSVFSIATCFEKLCGMK